MRSARPKIAVIILNWNNAPDTLECLASVYESKYPNFEVYVADNGSTDGSLAKIRKAYPQATYVENRVNLGFAEGNNRAIEKANDAEYIFLLNNDATIQKETLSLLEKAAKAHPNAAALGPKIYFYDAPSTIWYGGGEWNPHQASFYHRDQWLDESEAEKRGIEPTGYVCGCAFFAKMEAIRKVGLMEKRFFLNWEEVDWCWRLKKAGYECLYVPQAKAWHKISRSFLGGKRGAMWSYFYWRNRLLWMERNLPRKEYISLMFKVIFPQIRYLFRDAFGPEKDQARASLRGVYDYFTRRFGKGPSFLYKK